MLEQAVAYKPQDGYPLWITAKRYWLPAFEANTSDDALTLILLHSTSFHKETWEPTVQRLFQLVTNAADTGGGGLPVKIREAWVIDCPNHGVSAKLNEVALREPEFFDNFTCEKYARAVHHFLSAGPERGARVDFRSRNLFGIGHSLGSVAMTILQHLSPPIKFSAIILVEPMLSPAGPEWLYGLRSRLVKYAYERRDVWASREHALESLKKGKRTEIWHPKVLELFVEFALRSHPGSDHEFTPYNGVTLACTREQEAAMYRDVEGPTKPVTDLNEACTRMPVHIVFGDVNDFLPREVHEAVVDPSSGRRFASITRIPKVGHLVPQQAPEQLAEVIFRCLTTSSMRSKL
ncbi:hypothetical protein JAAARDRAFT_149140 [Jaapia argillacea MUCL 33604]|uniref:AB hydrolase-1 domain-containing protein n=1 Tax=Jaapia argillacea MUCL 33604 TaxID=933084 RepID=A0A067Q844_9AGAM|nr:hypothetical protein JAAARDRAFT_149140 [Jaapia argillacea MUCL 33604]